MSKKKFLVYVPSGSNGDRLDELKRKALTHYGSHDWEMFSSSEYYANIFKDFLDVSKNNACNGKLFRFGLYALVLSQLDSAYFPYDWEQDDDLKLLHLLAFKYGIEIVYEAV